jgi:hypothetical protein
MHIAGGRTHHGSCRSRHVFDRRLQAQPLVVLWLLVYPDYLDHFLSYEREGHHQAGLPFITWVPAGVLR